MRGDGSFFASLLRVNRLVAVLSTLFLLTTPALAKESNADGGYHAAIPTDVMSRLSFEGMNRKYLVHLPPSYHPADPTPLVLVLHGGGGDIGFAVRMFQFNQKADDSGFIVAYPNGSGRLGDHVLTWNTDACCGYAEAHHMNDVGFIRKFLDELENDYNIDKKRVYVVGFSNGAMMAYKLACQMPEKFAGFAAVSGSMNGAERLPAVPISGLIIHGLADRHIPIDGGGGKLAKWGFNVHAKPLEYCVDFWAAADGCKPPQVQELNDGEVECRKYLGGKDGTELIVYTIKDYKHSWPGGHRAWFRADPPYPDLSATDECWDLFSRHTRDANAEQLAIHR
ncbi:MAG TPA: PHB depolymerase family esterase [Candidatus Obscuribacterales bacterium]